MAASFIERCIHAGDYENDGGAVDLDEFENCLGLFEAGLISSQTIQDRFGVTQAQEDQIAALLNTMPSTDPEDSNARARWVRMVRAVINCGLWAQDSSTDGTYLDAYDTASEVAGALGISP